MDLKQRTALNESLGWDAMKPFYYQIESLWRRSVATYTLSQGIKAIGDFDLIICGSKPRWGHDK